MKKIIAATLCLSLAATAFLASCKKEEKAEEKNNSVVGEDVLEEVIEIPAEQEDYEIEIADFGDDYVTGAVIKAYLGEEKEIKVIETAMDPDTGEVWPVMAIGSSAFVNNENVEVVIVPETVVEIRAGAFESCPNLKAVSLPAGLLTIGDQAFFNSTKLEKLGMLLPVEEPEEAEETAEAEAAEEEQAEEEVVSLAESIGDEFPSTVTYIGKYAFNANIGISSPWFDKLVNTNENVILGDGVLVKVKNANETVYDFDNPVKSVAYYAFENLNGVNLKFSADLTEISPAAFYNKTNQNVTVTLPTTFESIGVFNDAGVAVERYISFPRAQHDFEIEFYTTVETEEGEEVKDEASVVMYTGEKEAELAAAEEEEATAPAVEVETEEAPAPATPVAVIVKYTGNDEEVAIPGEVVHPVLGVYCEVIEISAEAFKDNTTVKTVKLPDTIYSVADGTFPEGVTVE